MTKTLRLDAFLPYQLSITSNLVSDVIARAYVRLFALTVPEWRLIAVIAEHDALTQQDLCLRTRMDKVTVSRAAIALASRKLVIRTPHPQDGRSHRLSLSKDGADLYCEVAPQALELESRIFGQIEADELDRLSSILQRIKAAAEDMIEDG
jgi:DNA-binding MarR family transcriptional regulator